MVGVHAHNQVITLRAFPEILPRVIDNLIGAERSRCIHIPGAAHGSDFRPERLGNLDGKCTNTARRAIQQNRVARLDVSFIAKTLKGGKCRERYRCGLLKR